MKHNKRGITAALLLVVFVLAAVSVTSADDEGKPVVVIEEMRHDLGDVYVSDKYSHTFTVKNTGTADLMIDKVKPG